MDSAAHARTNDPMRDVFASQDTYERSFEEACEAANEGHAIPIILMPDLRGGKRVEIERDACSCGRPLFRTFENRDGTGERWQCAASFWPATFTNPRYPVPDDVREMLNQLG